MRLAMNYNSPNREIWHRYTTNVNIEESLTPLNRLSYNTLNARIVSSFAEIHPRETQKMGVMAQALGPVVTVQVLRPVSFNTDPTVDKLISTLLDLRSEALSRKDTLQADMIESRLMACGVILCPGGETIIWPKVDDAKTTKKS